MPIAIRRRVGKHIRDVVCRYTWLLRLWLFLSPPDYPGTRRTLRRLANAYRSRWEMGVQRTRLRSWPLKVTIEPINVCNLACPACFTGDGQTSRPRTAMPLDVYRRLLTEMGAYLWQVEFCNWGEPLLDKQIATMIREATDRGIGTILSTNFSFRFDDRRAEDIVRAGLTVLGVSIDGARQETYEKYRVGGDLATVLENCRRMRDAKRRLGATAPQMVWSFHAFPHNVGDIADVPALARELDMVPVFEKGWVVGADWDAGGKAGFRDRMPAFPCLFLWQQAVVNSDGGVAPCCGTFYREDDMGRLALRPGDGGAATFREVWNCERFRQARAMYRDRAMSPATGHVCYDCPSTIVWDRWKGHRLAGGTVDDFRPGFTPNDSFNYFWSRRPAGAAPPRRRAVMGTR